MGLAQFLINRFCFLHISQKDLGELISNGDLCSYKRLCLSA